MIFAKVEWISLVSWRTAVKGMARIPVGRRARNTRPRILLHVHTGIFHSRPAPANPGILYEESRYCPTSINANCGIAACRRCRTKELCLFKSCCRSEMILQDWYTTWAENRSLERKIKLFHRWVIEIDGIIVLWPKMKVRRILNKEDLRVTRIASSRFNII